MNSLSLFADRWQIAVDHLIAEAETPLLVVALFLSVLLLVGLWLFQGYIRGLAVAPRSRWRAQQAAEQRAEVLLQANVSELHYQHLLTHGYLEVASRLHPGRTYRLPRRPGRVTVYEAGRWVGQLCVIAGDRVPYADLILAQKWLIEADERAYLAIANWVNGPQPQRAIRGLVIGRPQPM